MDGNTAGVLENTKEAKMNRLSYEKYMQTIINHKDKKMSNVTYGQVLEILSGWTGNPAAKAREWGATHNFIIPPPPPPALINDQTLAQWIADTYTGPEITGG
jgi:hypothetical protein